MLPQQFSSELSDIVKSMLSREASKRPSVHQLLRNQYVRTHIKLFLDRASDRRKCVVWGPYSSTWFDFSLPSHQEEAEGTATGQGTHLKMYQVS